MSDSNPPVFSPTLIPQSCHTHLPSGYTLRPLARNDYAKNFFTCLQSLTTTGDISEAQFLERFDWMRTKGDGWFNNLVIEHEGKIAGTGVVIVEWKL